MILDTTILIDLHREYRGRPKRGAQAFFQNHAYVTFQVSVIAVVEFLEEVAKKEEASFLQAFRILPFEEAHAIQAARIRRDLRERGALIGDMDILIAAVALQQQQPLVTANEEHFSRIDGLKVQPYRTMK